MTVVGVQSGLTVLVSVLSSDSFSVYLSLKSHVSTIMPRDGWRQEEEFCTKKR